jgi:putative ABC transport system permease protein
MGALIALARRSLWARSVTMALTALAVAVSVALFLAVEKVRTGARNGFEQTISGTHLVVGARSGQVNLMLYAVFRIGSATANVSWQSYQEIAALPEVEWAVPLSLGDSHRGFRVVGTTPEYFARYAYAGDRRLELSRGEVFSDLYDVVLGAEVARALGYDLGSEVVLTHGLGQAGISDHKDRPFRVVGILKPTGTPVDRSLHVSLEAITAIHVGWESGARNPLVDTLSDDMIRSFDLTPRDITAALVGLKRPSSVQRVQRAINTFRGEALMAVKPVDGLKDLWAVTDVMERALLMVSAFVIVVGLVSILVSIVTGLNERRREMAVLRAVGAGPGHVFALLVTEAALVAGAGALAGVALVNGLLAVLGPLFTARFGVAMSWQPPGVFDATVVGSVVLAAMVMAMGPALAAQRRAVADGLSVKV